MSEEWLSLDQDEEVLWEGGPKIQRTIGFQYTDYVITNKAIYRKTGILSRSVQQIGFDKIQNTSFAQGFLAKTLGYGSVAISTAGGSGAEMVLRGVDDPDTVQTMINERTGKDGGKSERTSDSSEVVRYLASIDRRLQSIESKLDSS